MTNGDDALASPRSSAPGCSSTGSSLRRLGGPGQEGPQPVRRPRGRRAASRSWRPGHGRADYLLYVDKTVVGVIEAKPEGTPLSGVEWQSAMYAEGLPADVRLKALTVDGRLPFVFEARAPRPTSPTATTPTREHAESSPSRSRRRWPGILRDAEADPEAPTWRGKVRAPARAGHRSPAARADRRDLGRRAEPVPSSGSTAAWSRWRPARARPTPPSPQSYRLLKHGGFNRDPVPGRPQQPRRPDAGGVPELPHPRRRPPVHRALQRRQAHQRGHARLVQGRHLDDPAGLQGAARTRRSPTEDDPG